MIRWEYLNKNIKSSSAESHSIKQYFSLLFSKRVRLLEDQPLYLFISGRGIQRASTHLKLKVFVAGTAFIQVTDLYICAL